MSYALSSFAPPFFLEDGDAIPRASKKPTSVLQVIVSLSNDEWESLAAELFHIDPGYLTIEGLLTKVEETNTCLNLDSPVEVFIDPEGAFTLLVYDIEEQR